MGGSAQAKWRWLLGAGLGVFAIAFALGLSRARYGIGHTTFDYMSQARWLLAGGGLEGLTATQPPGYVLLWLPLLRLPDPLLAGFVLSLLCHGATVWLVHALLARLVSPMAAAIGAMLVALNGALAGSADYVWVEAPFTAALAAAWFGFERLMSRGRERHGFAQLLLAAALAVLPLYLRYAAAPVLGVMVGLALLAAVTRRRRDLFLYVALIGLLALPLPLLNWAIEGRLSGHPLGVAPAQHLVAAFTILARELGSAFVYILPSIREAPLFNLTNASGAAMRMPLLAALIGIVAILLPLAAGLLMRRGPLLRLSLAVLAYILFYAYIASHTRIDRLSLRFVVPIIPFAIAAWVLAAPLLGRVAPLLLAGSVAGFALVGLLEGLAPDRYGYSPQTIAALDRTMPPGALLLTNAYGRQLAVFAPQFRLLPLPYDDPFNDGYSAAYGIQPWSEAELEEMLTREKVSALVMLLGPSGDDPYLDLGAYGEAVQRVLEGKRPGSEVTRRPDGIVVRFSTAPE